MALLQIIQLLAVFIPQRPNEAEEYGRLFGHRILIKLLATTAFRPLLMKTDSPNYRKRVYDLVRQIPKGRIMTYGQIAIMLGDGYTPRTVGYIMRNANTDKIPWQRVINSKGGCSTGRILAPHDIQQQLLEAEGVAFNARGFCKVEEYRWEPR